MDNIKVDLTKGKTQGENLNSELIYNDYRASQKTRQGKY
jgi:hypothetical protein